MRTTQQDIREWLESGKLLKATHMLIVCDTFDYDDYPVYVEPGENVDTKIQEYSSQSMQSILEVYSYSMDLEQQIREPRVWNVD